jgi:aminomethyltransferase
MPDLLFHTPLHALHERLGAKLVPFAGYAMPVQYPDGIIQEHLHTRAAAGLFDVSHMGQVTLHCALPELARLLPTDLAALAPLQTSYTLLLNECGGVIDDLMVTRLNAAGDAWFLVVNASRKHIDVAHLRSQLPDSARVLLHDDRALLALQGPQALTAMATLLPAATGLRFMHGGWFESAFGTLFITRSGYTGEDGFEISVPSQHAVQLTETLLALPQVKPMGLGARDTLRLEAGLCLYGHELDETISPAEARLNWVISKARRTSADFIGAKRVLAELAAAPARVRVGLVPDGRGIAREQTVITDLAGATIGLVTSGGFSPTLQRPIAMGLVPPEQAAAEQPVMLIVRGQPTPARVAKLPFVPHNYVKS